MTEKQEVHWTELFWETLKIEHLRDGCEECRAGRCLQTGEDDVRLRP